MVTDVKKTNFENLSRLCVSFGRLACRSDINFLLGWKLQFHAPLVGLVVISIFRLCVLWHTFPLCHIDCPSVRSSDNAYLFHASMDNGEQSLLLWFIDSGLTLGLRQGQRLGIGQGVGQRVGVTGHRNLDRQDQAGHPDNETIHRIHHHHPARC